ncbi:DUF4097 domain-containing protein [Wenzhouxiangella sp. XN79A]|uniref:DUF4097 domain-containing protein n=1 Tax=Wenzhouxiangella sp. XN79A TaxID=2724193 RepID=UPI00144AB154|nr:DUF4097 domain-containing protein [Wenzhouxiangella sp. XN79A]NKI35599.1 DUF4097 domain-containing protein [Wenzhouxiangella sp. XN79A]
MSAPSAVHRIVLPATAALLLGACSFGEPTLQETREMELTVAPGSALAIQAGAGPMTVAGHDGDSILVEARIYQRSANDDYRLLLETDGNDGARLVAETGSGSFGTSDYIDLAIRVPRTMQLRIEDGSGSLCVRDLDGDLDIEDGSGSITIASIGGNVVVEDGSGSISIEGVGGDLRIDDGSGSIEASQVAGTVSISDGSGSITVRDAGDFELREDGSGSVTLEGIRSRGESD